ncbi:MAG: Ca2+-binding RTX toxin-like protein [Sulfitobacter sp.]|jgi:Ca2+-binding RTX toxin-like protein
MIRTIDFNALGADVPVTDAYLSQGVTISATGGLGRAAVLNTADPAIDHDLQSDLLKGALIIESDAENPASTGSDAPGSLFFDFDGPVRIKSLTFKDIESQPDAATRLIFYAGDGSVLENHWVDPTADGGERTVGLSVPGTARLEVVLPAGGAVDNLIFEDSHVHHGNHDPDAVADTIEVEEDGTVVIAVLDNDSDPDGDPLAVSAASSPDGTVTITAAGSLEFTPAADFNGPTSISYTIEDGRGGSDSSVVDVTVTPVNDAPVAEDDLAETDQGQSVIIPIRANDSDPDDDTETLVLSDLGSEQGAVTDNGDGSVTFTPAAGFSGEAVISYRLNDPQGASDLASVGVTVHPANSDPVAQDDVVQTEEDTAILIDVRSNDSDPDDDPLTLGSASSPDGTVEIIDGQLLFTPLANFNGPTSISYTVEDGRGGADTAEVSLLVTPVNDAPVAGDDSAETAYETPLLNVAVLSNDNDPDGGDLLRVIAAQSEDGSVEINPDQSLNFIPATGFTGAALVTYTLSDRPAGDPDALTDSGVLSINVAAPLGADGFVDGSFDDDIIDEDYIGDPDGDRVDHGDAILFGAGPEDDFIRAGAGDDRVSAGLGDDIIEAGSGDDVIAAGAGRDSVFGGDGKDIIDTSTALPRPDQGYPYSEADGLGFTGDPDPEDDRDWVDGGADDDIIRTGDDRDTITGGAGADLIDGGVDDDVICGDSGADRIVGGEGNDNIFGGSGNDTIYAGNDPALGLDILDIPDAADADHPFAPDRNPLNGRDTVSGGDGNDVIYGADDDDLLLGGAGADYLDGEIDDDHLSGGTGRDTLIGGQGEDTLFGNEDADELDGGSGNDLLDGGGDDDILSGGDGDDILLGAEGDDSLNGGAGFDTMTGGAGRDLFTNVGFGDVIDGGDGAVDFDTLDLRGSLLEGGRMEINYTSEDQEDGFVRYFDAEDTEAGLLSFQDIEAIVPCFTPGTLIATPKGERRVENLRIGDRVITRDNGLQEIRWVGSRALGPAELRHATTLWPVLIRQGALGKGLPERDMLVSPNHRVLSVSDENALYFEEREVLVAAKHLTKQPGIDVVETKEITYVHLMFDHHEVILSDGAWTESFQPGDQALAGIASDQRDEVLSLFPELATPEGITAYGAARRSLRRHEAEMLTR